MSITVLDLENRCRLSSGFYKTQFLGEDNDLLKFLLSSLGLVQLLHIDIRSLNWQNFLRTLEYRGWSKFRCVFARSDCIRLHKKVLVHSVFVFLREFVKLLGSKCKLTVSLKGRPCWLSQRTKVCVNFHQQTFPSSNTSSS